MIDAEEEVRRQVWAGIYNRRVARAIENGEGCYKSRALSEQRVGRFLCTCGREDCAEVLSLKLEEHRFVREKPYRFLVAPGHATEVDEVVPRAETYEVVEVRPEYRPLVRDVAAEVMAKLKPEQKGRPRRTAVTVEAPETISASSLTERLVEYQPRISSTGEDSSLVTIDHASLDGLRAILDRIDEWAVAWGLKEIEVRIGGKAYRLAPGTDPGQLGWIDI